MKISRIAAASAALAAVLAHAVAPPPTPPIVEILSPTTATVFSSSWPVSVPITTRMTMQEGEIKSLTQFNVKVNNVSLTDNLNPFDNNNGCALVAPLSCPTTSPTVGSVTVPFSVTEPGTYTILASARYKSDSGSDTETLTYLEMSVEYPAPPAVANAYLNATFKSQLTAGQRGCVISKIAENHAKLSAYGVKGGPYNTWAIQNDVSNFLGQCPR